MRKMTQQERIRFGLDGDFSRQMIGTTFFLEGANRKPADVLFWMGMEDVVVQVRCGEDTLNWEFTIAQAGCAESFAKFLHDQVYRIDVLRTLGGVPA